MTDLTTIAEVISPPVPRSIAVTTAGSNPPHSLVRRILVLINNASLSSAGIVQIMLGNSIAIPVFLPATPATGSYGTTAHIAVYDGVEPIAISEFSLSQPLSGGSISLLTVSA